MAYTKKTWVSKETITAAALNNIEDGVQEAITGLTAKANAADVYTKAEVDGKLTSAFTYKGSVATADALPQEGNKTGDVYNVEDTGINYAWDGEKWDSLSGTVDLTGYLTKDEAGQTYVTQTALSESLAGKANTADLEGMVKYSPFVYNDQTRKTIQLANYDSLSGVTTQGVGVNLAMVSQWDKADFGSMQVTMNLNSKDGIVQLNDEKVLATVDQIPDVSIYATAVALTEGLEGKQDKGDYALKSEVPTVPTALPNPNALTIKYNGQVAFTYDGSKAETGNFIVNGETVPVTADNDQTLKAYIDAGLAGKQATGDYALKSDVPSVEGLVTEAALTEGLAGKQDKGDYATNEVVQAEFESYDKTIKAYVEQQVTLKADQVEVDSLDSRVDVVESISGNVYTMQSQIAQLMDQVQQLKTPTVESVEISAEQPSVDQPDQDVSFNATVNGTVGTITAKSIQSTNASIQSGRLAATATNDVSIKNLSTSGDLAKSTANAGLSVNTNEYVTITGADWQQTGYNGIEVGLSSAPKSVLIDGVDFKAAMSNNAISIFSWQENAVITISNCHFANVSNPLRLSNRDNKPCTINIVNCTCDQWVAGEYAGFICMQDYTSSSAQAAQEANQFGKLTINFVNCSGPDGRIVGNAQQLAENHIIYIYTDQEGLIAFGDGSRYPTVTAQ